MGNPLRLTDAGRTQRILRAARFGVGLTGMFLSTLAIALAALALGAGLLPTFHTTVVASGSMSPAIRRGDVVVHREVDIDEVGEGTVVVYDDHGTSIVHRVIDVNDDGPTPASLTLTTRGDANADPDSVAVTAGLLSGAGVILVPWVGLPRLWWFEGRQWLVLVTALATLFALFSSRWATATANDPWSRDLRLSPAESWLGRPPPPPAPLVPAGLRSLILDRARSCG